MDSETKLAQTELQNQGKLEVEALVKQAGSANVSRQRYSTRDKKKHNGISKRDNFRK